ncbi:hypothetical protein EMIHUDRAFT_115016 [Emiliania huxleyi CCMP1516]|uniref:Peptidase M14 domain-containing protein n=2 Tax=Emiliania huxleyi TaxID=2903 RepID=A0A0D3JT67_EMIH1|nr:hypothetical protein EMIHUDRAFT_115016 [Emiliania huxleyi CCMP1516]EOD26702.1 hypothetical protein EMIHUDRAFT_115016 [Emiliania huxleyi CCMP1516]|eukprot:XP_005779131.1 hypothetical protein EMIHUDRAFT_115016 [Emiliania huxleyi CCMP1516]
MLSLLALLPGLPAPPTDSWFEAYKTFDEIVTFMDNTDFTSRNVLVYQYGDPTKPGLLVLCTVHAREWISAMACPWVAQQLAGDDTAILETNAVYIMPVVNPDGYAFSHAPEGNRYFRTNRRPGSYFGVDLNRNFPRHWNSCSQWRRCSSGNVGSSSQTYRGPSPGSEPETRAVMAVADEIEATSGLVLFVDVHSYSAVVSGRYDDATADISPISAQQNVAGPKIVDAMNSIDGYGTTHCYQYWTAADWSYSADGDHMFEEYGQPWSWLIELRPQSSGQGGFTLPASEILPTVQEVDALKGCTGRKLALFTFQVCPG